jgi:hypothetical protein
MGKQQNIERKNKMKKLTDADYALLAARGKVTKPFNTVTDFEIPTWNKPKKSKKSITKKANNHPLVGKILHTSWGYSMTINNFCKIIEVSPSGKTVVCRMLTKEGFNGYAGEVKAGSETYGPKFRLKIKDGWNGSPSYTGSYPYISNSRDNEGFVKRGEGTRMGYFTEHDPEHKVFENRMD